MAYPHCSESENYIIIVRRFVFFIKCALPPVPNSIVKTARLDSFRVYAVQSNRNFTLRFRFYRDYTKYNNNNRDT